VIYNPLPEHACRMLIAARDRIKGKKPELSYKSIPFKRPKKRFFVAPIIPSHSRRSSSAASRLQEKYFHDGREM
jgi:hypothetical protein